VSSTVDAGGHRGSVVAAAAAATAAPRVKKWKPMARGSLWLHIEVVREGEEGTWVRCRAPSCRFGHDAPVTTQGRSRGM
jgi:hypothetical protein